MPQFHAPWAGVIFVSSVVLLTLTLWGFVILSVVPAWRVGCGVAGRRGEELLHGFLAFSLLGFVGVLLSVPLDLTFAAVSVVVVAVTFKLGKRRHVAVQAAASLDSRAAGAPYSNALLLFAALAGSLLWSMNNLRGLQPSSHGLSLVPWVDFFFHARVIGMFSQFDGDSTTLHWSMAGESLPAYHYGGYMVSALVARLGDFPAIQVATSLYPVLGMLLTGLAMVVLLTRDGQGAGAAALGLGLLYLIPDPTNWVPGLTRLHSYFFFQQVGVGGAYAVALMGLALACALESRRVRSWPLWLLAGCLFGISALFKVQIFIAYGVFFFAFLMLVSPGLQWSTRVALAVVSVLAFAGLIAVLQRVPNAPTIEFSLQQVRQAFRSAGGIFHGATAPSWMVIGVMLPIAAAGALAGIHGVLFPVAVGLIWRLRDDPVVRSTIALATLTLLATVVVRLLISDNRGGWGDGYEINRKTLVWPYFVLVYCSARLAWRAAEKGPRFVPALRFGAGVAIGGLTVASALSADRLQNWNGYNGRFNNVAVSVGLANAAAYLRLATGPRDVVQLCEIDAHNQLASLAERVVYIASFVGSSSPMKADEKLRVDAVRRIVDADSALLARAASAAVGIDWMLLSPHCHPSWEGAIIPTLTTDGYRLVRLAP